MNPLDDRTPAEVMTDALDALDRATALLDALIRSHGAERRAILRAIVDAADDAQRDLIEAERLAA